MTSCGGSLVCDDLTRTDHDGGEIERDDLGEKVLLDGLYRFAGEVFDFQPLFLALIAFLDAPTQMV